MKTKIQRILLLAGAVLAGAPAIALAHPMSDEVMKFQQLPMDGVPVDGALWWGHDELSTSWGDHSTGLYGNNAAFPSQFMADDFADTVSTPVAHIRWWGSYINNQPFNHVQKFLISFETDVANIGPFSYPGTPLLSQVVVPGAITQNSGTYTETFVSPGSGQPGGEALYMYNAELKLPFPEQADTVYWLKIVALVDPVVDGPVEWGWHNRDYTITDTFASPNVTPGEFIEGVSPGGSANVWHFQDDSITGLISGIDLNNNSAPGGIAFLQHLPTFFPQKYVDNLDGPMGISQYSKDLAFELFTRVPEPSTYALGVLGLLALMVVGRRKWKRSCGASTRELRPTHTWTRSRFMLSRKRLAHLAIAGALLLWGAQLSEIKIRMCCTS